MFGKRGCVQIYTGDGKGKTTAALGLALRAAGHGARVMIIQFMKGWKFYGELESVKNIPRITIIQTGRPDYVHQGQETEEDFAEAGRGLQIAKGFITANSCDLLILDEIIVALDFGLVSLDEVIELIIKRPKCMELLLTGRGADKRLYGYADLITEMREIKHPYRSGVRARKAIEY